MIQKKESIKREQECSYCEGTGLYSGMGEGKYFAVQCYYCKGTGKFIFEHTYNLFKGRKKAPSGVKRVLQCNPGIYVGAGSGYTLEDFGGVAN